MLGHVKNAKGHPKENGEIELFSLGTFSDLNLSLSFSKCHLCGNIIIWLDKKIIFPNSPAIPPPHEMMPKNVKDIYVEAVSVYDKSNRAAAALLRLALQHLLKEIGGTGKNINDDIRILLSNGTIKDEVQQACDTLRVIGNNAVHPGQIVIDDTPEITKSLFELLNYIVEENIELPAKRKKMFESLPDKTKEAISKRDKK